MEGTIQLKKYRTMRRRYGQVSAACSAEFLCHAKTRSNNLYFDCLKGVDATGEARRINESLNDLIKWQGGGG